MYLYPADLFTHCIYFSPDTWLMSRHPSPSLSHPSPWAPLLDPAASSLSYHHRNQTPLLISHRSQPATNTSWQPPLIVCTWQHQINARRQPPLCQAQLKTTVLPKLEIVFQLKHRPVQEPFNLLLLIEMVAEHKSLVLLQAQLLLLDEVPHPQL